MVRKKELLEFNHGSYYVSASSKRLGIDYDEFKSLTKESSKVNLPGIGAKYTLVNDKEVTLLADGFPVNFFMGESVPDKAIAFILVLLFKSAEFVVEKGNTLPNAIIGMNNKQNDQYGLYQLQQEIAETHSQLY